MTWINTLSGKHLDFTNISPDSICIEDIAAALSNICRFTGHLEEFYSVAQHSVRVSYLVPPEFALEALMHDAAEAYCNDISSPLKALLPEYRVIEDRIEAVIRSKFHTALLATQQEQAKCCCGKCGDQLPVQEYYFKDEVACWVNCGWHETKFLV